MASAAPKKTTASKPVAKKKPINSRARGLRGERELKNMLIESFPEYADKIRRNQDQSERGGHDLFGLPGFAPECKNVNDVRFFIVPFWKQTVDQAEREDCIPVLFRKRDFRGWTVYIHLKHLSPAVFGESLVRDVSLVAQISYDAFVLWAREYIRQRASLSN